MITRTLHRLIHRSRTLTLFGERAYIEVRLPASVVPAVAVAPWLPPGDGWAPTSWVDIYERTVTMPDGTREEHCAWIIHRYADDGTPAEEVMEVSDIASGRIISCEPLSHADNAHRRAAAEWEESALGIGEVPPASPIIAAMNRLYELARTDGARLDGDHVRYVFGIKAFRPDIRRDVVRAMRRMMRTCKRLGVHVRVVGL